MHRARAALAVIAALFGAGKVQILAQAIKQRGPRIETQTVALSVYLQRYRDCARNCRRGALLLRDRRSRCGIRR